MEMTKDEREREGELLDKVQRTSLDKNVRKRKFEEVKRVS